MLEEGIFVLSLFARAGGLGWGPLHRVLSGQGNKNLACRKEPAQAGPGLLQQAHLYEVLGELEPSLGLSSTIAPAPTKRLLVRWEEDRVSQWQNWRVSPGPWTPRASQVHLAGGNHAGCWVPFHSASGHNEKRGEVSAEADLRTLLI